MDILIYGYILVGIIILILSYIIWQKVKQVAGYEAVVSEYEAYMTDLTYDILEIDSEMDRIDNEGTFRSDDEIGFFYQSLYDLIKKLAKYGYAAYPKKEEMPEYKSAEEAKMFYNKDKRIVKNKNKRKQDK